MQPAGEEIEPQKFHFLIVDWSGDEVARVEATPTDKIQCAHQQITNQLGCLSNQQRLTHEGRLLDGHRTWNDYEIEDWASIQITIISQNEEYFAEEDKMNVKGDSLGYTTKLSTKILERGHRFFVLHHIEKHNPSADDGNFMVGIWMDMPDKMKGAERSNIGASSRNGSFGYYAQNKSSRRFGDGRDFQPSPEFKMKVGLAAATPFEGRFVGVLLDLVPGSTHYRSLALFTSDTTDVTSVQYRGVLADAVPDSCDYRSAVSLYHENDRIISRCWMDENIPPQFAYPPPS